jgi:UDP-N-acetylglucosamine acyltransferase
MIEGPNRDGKSKRPTKRGSDGVPSPKVVCRFDGMPSISDVPSRAHYMEIHSTAIVSPGAILAPNVSIGPYAVIESDVEIGEKTEIGAHSVIKRFTKLGSRNRVFEHVILGGEPQDVKFKGETSSLIIGDDNLIREFCTFHRANGEGTTTRVGSRNFFMVGIHVAHNCDIGDDNIFANDVALAGHIVIEDHVFLSNNVGAHQFVRMGRYAMIGGKSKIVQDVLPFFITDGNPARVRGLNSVGLRRAQFSLDARRALKSAYRSLFRSDLPLADALSLMDQQNDEHVSQLAAFIRNSRRGFIRAKRNGAESSQDEDSVGAST